MWTTLKLKGPEALHILTPSGFSLAQVAGAFQEVGFAIRFTQVFALTCLAYDMQHESACRFCVSVSGPGSRAPSHLDWQRSRH